MTEAILEGLAGPSGGIFASGLILGGAIGWTLSQNVIVKEARRRIVKLESKVDELQRQVYDEIRRNHD